LLERRLAIARDWRDADAVLQVGRLILPNVLVLVRNIMIARLGRRSR